ncbi:hypothetical protein V1525DRAFT_391934 [Lipomyces kononenkoae]|uniref:Uncharacterized protein n=1 Tax=Lipomyces kononenkoae TaxID=34357 RepID=A0ACC3SQU5_LIPKO
MVIFIAIWLILLYTLAVPLGAATDGLLANTSRLLTICSVSVKLVLADGSIATASEAENSELFWAVRGAGQNFGVAVEFVYRLYEQPNHVWAGVLAFSPDKIEAVVQFANHLEMTTKGESAIVFGFLTPPSATEPGIVAAVFYDGAVTDALRVFATLLSLEPIMNTTTEMPYSMVNGMLNPLVEPGHRRGLHAASFFAPAMEKSVLDKQDEEQVQVEDIAHEQRDVSGDVDHEHHLTFADTGDSTLRLTVQSFRLHHFDATLVMSWMVRQFFRPAGSLHSVSVDLLANSSAASWAVEKEITCGVPICTGGIHGEIFSYSRGAFLASKIILGIGLGFYLTLGPMTCSEITPVVLRGLSTSGINLGISIGQLFIERCD